MAGHLISFAQMGPISLTTDPEHQLGCGANDSRDLEPQARDPRHVRALDIPDQLYRSNERLLANENSRCFAGRGLSTASDGPASRSG